MTLGEKIASARKEKGMTQEMLAEQLGVTRQAVARWETGKCMPDYAVVKSLCQGLEITVAELMDGEETEEKSIRTYDNDKIMDLLKRTQKLEQQKNILYGVLLLIIGIALQALSHTIGESDVRNFFSGLLLGVSVAEMLVGIYVAGKI